MEQGTNSAGAKFRPIKINYGGFLQEHIRYMRKYKDQKEAEDFRRKANERDYKHKISKEREKLLPEIGIGDIQGLYRDQRVTLYKDEARELAQLKQNFKDTGNPESKLKYDQRAEFYKNANELTGAFNEYSKYYAENQADLNPELDGGKVILAEHLAKGRFKLTKAGLKIPADDLVLQEFNLTREDADKDGHVVIPNQVMTEKLMNSGRFSGKAKFNVTGLEIANGIALDSEDGNVIATPENHSESIRQWETRLLENPTQLKTIAKLMKFDPSKEIDATAIRDFAINLHEEFTEPKWKQVDNSLANKLKKQANSRANFVAYTKDNKDAETITLATDNSGNILAPKDENVTSTAVLEGHKLLVNLPVPIKYGSPTSNGVVKVEQVKKDNNGKWVALGFKLVESPDGEEVLGKQKYKTTSEPVTITNIEDLNAIVKKVKTGKGKTDQFDNLGEFDKFAESLDDNKETKEERKKRLGLR